MCPGDLCITVVIVGARNLKNISTLGKLDPYVRIIYGKDEYKTSVIKDGGCSPIWNYEMCFTGSVPVLKVEVYDAQLFKDKLIGSAEISIRSLPVGVQNLAFNLHCPKYAGECTGVLLTKISVLSSSRGVYHSPLQRRISNPQYPPDPVLYLCLTHACYCHYNSYPPVACGSKSALPSIYPTIPIHSQTVCRPGGSTKPNLKRSIQPGIFPAIPSF